MDGQHYLGDLDLMSRYVSLRDAVGVWALTECVGKTKWITLVEND